jgi:hypothetical protein
LKSTEFCYKRPQSERATDRQKNGKNQQKAGFPPLLSRYVRFALRFVRHHLMPNVNGAKCFANFMEMFNLRCGVFTTLPVFELTLSICFESMMSL